MARRRLRAAALPAARRRAAPLRSDAASRDAPPLAPGEQLLGVLCLAVLSALPTLLVAFVLRWLRLLRVPAELERKGLDTEFGLAAYKAHNAALPRCAHTARLLRDEGFTPEQLLAALEALRFIIYRPFTPQALLPGCMRSARSQHHGRPWQATGRGPCAPGSAGMPEGPAPAWRLGLRQAKGSLPA